MLVAIACLAGLPVASASFHLPIQQSQSKPNCPTVKVVCIDAVSVGEQLKITAMVTGGDPNVTPTYNWTVSAGTIESGQGTSSIDVSTAELTESGFITATVDIGGFDRECNTAESCTSNVIKKAEARKLDEYGALEAKDENERLDNFVIELQNDPTTQGYIIAYGGRTSRATDVQKAADKAKNYMVSKRNADPSRLATVNGGLREQPATELWIVPFGAEPPVPTPTVKPGEAKPTKPKSSGNKKS